MSCMHISHLILQSVARRLRYIANVATNPGEEKFRSIKKSNAAFQVGCYIAACHLHAEAPVLPFARMHANTRCAAMFHAKQPCPCSG